MANANAQHLWEQDLKEEIFAANAALRRDGIYEGAELNVENISQEAEGLGIDPDRATKIASAAQSDFDWSEAVDDMVREGVPQEAAEEIAVKISAQIAVTRFWHDSPLERARDKVELAWSLVGTAAIVATVGLVIAYWSSILSTIETAGSCVARALG